MLTDTGVVSLLALFTAVVFAVFWRRRSTTYAKSELPPGPPGRPFIGNLILLAPSSEAVWERMSKYKPIYGKSSNVV